MQPYPCYLYNIRNYTLYRPVETVCEIDANSKLRTRLIVNLHILDVKLTHHEVERYNQQYLTNDTKTESHPSYDTIWQDFVNNIRRKKQNTTQNGND